MWFDADIDAPDEADAVAAHSGGPAGPRGGARLRDRARRLFGHRPRAGGELARGRRCWPSPILFYVVVYTMWLKRLTAQNIVIGGAAGALPPVIGWAAMTGGVSLEPLLYFLVIFMWTPPHFWALALVHPRRLRARRHPHDAERGGRRIDPPANPLLFACCLRLWARCPGCSGRAGLPYGVAALVLGARIRSPRLPPLAPPRGRQASRREAPVRLLDLLSVRALRVRAGRARGRPACRWVNADAAERPLAPEQARRRRRRSVALALLLAALVVLFYVIALVRGPGIAPS